MHSRDRMLQRLDIIAKNRTNISIPDMRSAGIVSAQYNFRNLATDLWYLSCRNSRIAYEIAECHDCDDPIKSIWFRCLVIAISDARSKRPCDLGAWVGDFPPMGIETCSSKYHLCAPEAVGFLLSLDDEHERLGGLTPGTIRAIIGKDLAKEYEDVARV
jgi:hypothetical protein